jgi:CRP-like cAMP-binding protein
MTIGPMLARPTTADPSRAARETMVTQIDLLRQMPIFGGLNTETLEFLLDLSNEVFVAEGDYFFREQERGSSVFVLESGVAQVHRLRNGSPIVLRQLREGDCFGEMALIDFLPRSASVMAETNCQAIEIPANLLIKLHRKNLEQYAMIMMNLGREVSRRLRLAGDRLFELEQPLQDSLE